MLAATQTSRSFGGRVFQHAGTLRELPRIPKRRSSRWRESLYSPTPIGRCAPEGGCHIVGYYVSYVRTCRLVALMYIRQPLRHQGGAKRRAGAWVLWELRPYERSRFAEHIRKVEELCYRGVVPAPPEVVMAAPHTLLSNASIA